MNSQLREQRRRQRQQAKEANNKAKGRLARGGPGLVGAARQAGEQSLNTLGRPHKHGALMLHAEQQSAQPVVRGDGTRTLACRNS
jgi:hypothetical protein